MSVTVPSAATAKLPVVYLLDGQWEYALVRPILGALAQDHFIPDAVLLGIAFGGDDQASRTARVEDITSTSDK